MQILLAAALVFVALWFTVLRPKDEPVAASPVVAAATTPAGTSVAGALENDINKAKSGAAAADAAVQKREALTGEDDPSSSTPASTPAKSKAEATTPAKTTPAKTTPQAAPAGTTPAERAAAKAKAAKDSVPAAQRKANDVIESIGKDLSARRVAVVLIWSKSNSEDRELHRRVTKEIDRRKGKVRVYLISVGDVGRYDGLLSGLAISQTPSTIVIAPDNTAKVIGGLTSTVRIDRLTSSALQTPAPEKTK